MMQFLVKYFLTIINPTHKIYWGVLVTVYTEGEKFILRVY